MARTAAKPSKEVSEELVNLLKRKRLSKFHSLAEEAKEYDVAIETYRMWELGKTAPRLDKVKQIASVLGVSAGDVLRFIEPSYRPPAQ